MTGKEFANWMDDAGMSLETATKYFGVSEQTIYNWRSTRGIPESRLPWVEERMREFIRTTGVENLPDRVTLEVTAVQFDEWNRAALAEGKILRQWAIDVLDEAAAADDQTGSDGSLYPVPSPSLLRVAEAETPETGLYHDPAEDDEKGH